MNQLQFQLSKSFRHGKTFFESVEVFSILSRLSGVTNVTNGKNQIKARRKALEKLNQVIEDRILEVKALAYVSSDKVGEHVLLEGEVREMFVEAVSEGLRISENVSGYYLTMGRHLAKHKPKLKEHRVYGAACQELGLKKSTANNILKLYETFGDRVRDMISLIPVRKLLVICAHNKLKRDELIKFCQDHIDEIRRCDGADLRAWVKGEPFPEPKAPEQEKVGSFIIKKSPSKKTVIIELNQSDEKLQASVSDYLCECMTKFESWKKNLQRVGSREVEVEPTEPVATETVTNASADIPILPEVIEINKFMREQEGTPPAQVIPFAKKTEKDETTQESTEGPGVSDVFAVAHAGAGDAREGVVVLE